MTTSTTNLTATQLDALAECVDDDVPFGGDEPCGNTTLRALIAMARRTAEAERALVVAAKGIDAIRTSLAAAEAKSTRRWQLLREIVVSLYHGRPMVCPDNAGKCSHRGKPARVLCYAYLEAIAAEVDTEAPPAAPAPTQMVIEEVYKGLAHVHFTSPSVFAPVHEDADPAPTKETK